MLHEIAQASDSDDKPFFVSEFVTEPSDALLVV